MLKAKHINRKKMLVVHSVATLLIVAACGLAWAFMGNQKADAKLTGEESKPLTITQVEPDASVDIWIDKGNEEHEWSANIKYSKNGGAYSAYTLGDKIKLNENDSVSFIGNNPDGFSKANNIGGKFYYDDNTKTGDPKLEASGNVMSLLSEDLSIRDIPCDFCFYSLFADMKILTKAPVLPAIVLKTYCYASMFEDCEKLCNAPDLPAIELEKCSYSRMFRNCSSLNYISVSFIIWDSSVQDSPTRLWLENVANNGTFVCPVELEMTYNDNYAIPVNWNVNRMVALNYKDVDVKNSVFQYDGTEKEIDISVNYGKFDITSKVIVEGQTKATDPGIYTYTVKVSPSASTNAEEVLPSGEYTGQWCIYNPNSPAPTPDPGGGGASEDISGTGTPQTSDMPLYVGMILLAILATHAGLFLYWRHTLKSAKHL